VRGLSYYNGNVFEIKVNGIKETIIGGGSYMINNIQCTGISFGLERISQISNIKLKGEGLLVISLTQDKESIKLAQKFREKGNIVSIYYGKPSKALEYANSYNYNKVIFIGEKEVKERKFKVKDMKTGKDSETITISQPIEIITTPQTSSLYLLLFLYYLCRYLDTPYCSHRRRLDLLYHQRGLGFDQHNGHLA